MTRYNRMVFAFILVLGSLLGLSTMASAQITSYKNATRLGGATSFYRTPLTDVASLRKMAATPAVTADLRKLLASKGISADLVLNILSNVSIDNSGDSCGITGPKEGTIAECDVLPGTLIEWMAYRPNARHGDKSMGLLSHIRWAGKQSFRAFVFQVTDKGMRYVFMIPKVCGNFALLSQTEMPKPAAPPLEVVVVIVPPAPKTEPTPAPVVIVVPPPPPIPVAVKHTRWFVDEMFGKDRRVRPTEGRLTRNGQLVSANAGQDLFAQCSPELGMAVGMSYTREDNLQVAAKLGIAPSLVHADHKIRESAVFADVELTKYMDHYFVGSGVSFWDLNHSDTHEPAILARIGHTFNSRYALQGEGRLFVRKANDLSNNYQFWAGMRAQF